HQAVSRLAYAQQPFRAGAKHPSCRTRVPGPAAASDLRRLAVDICSYHVGFNLVCVHPGTCRGMVDRIEHIEHLSRAVAVAERGPCDGTPDGCVRVLPAIFAQSRKITLDIAGIERGAVEWRSEKQDQVITAA